MNPVHRVAEQAATSQAPASHFRTRLAWRFRVPKVLVLVLLVSFLVRLPGLGKDLVCDEAVSLFAARGAGGVAQVIPNGLEFTSRQFRTDGGWHGTLMAVADSERTPPVYCLLLRAWTKLWGEDNGTLRLLSVLFGVATIPALFLLARSMFDTRAGLASAAVLAVLPLHVEYSQEVRAYALAVFLLTLAIWTYWQASQATSTGRRVVWSAGYVGLATASLYTHYLSASYSPATGRTPSSLGGDVPAPRS